LSEDAGDIGHGVLAVTHDRMFKAAGPAAGWFRADRGAARL